LPWPSAWRSRSGTSTRCSADDLVDHRTWVISGDGDLMEGVNHEAAGLAGHLQLGRLNVLWDNNKITIDGATDLSTSEDIPARYRASGWHVVSCDGHDFDSIRRALDEAVADPRPSLIDCRTIIGWGAPNKMGTSATHGSALGADEVKAAREHLVWDSEPFDIPEPILAAWRAAGARGVQVHEQWRARLAASPHRRSWCGGWRGGCPPAARRPITSRG
jgi:transketolase